LTLLGTLPETPARAQRELALELALGPALMATKGYAAPEVDALALAEALAHPNLTDVNFERGMVTVEDKAGLAHRYHISLAGLQAIRAYLERERPQDAAKWTSPALFLSPATTPHGNGRLTARVINTVWHAAAQLAGIQGKTPHAARHAMGQYIMEKTGNVAAVQRQLGYRHAAYAIQYARVTAAELAAVINDRG
jgi:site-specific recombinase XerD